MKSNTEPTNTNRLANETSPYLLQHAHNPVDWYPWGEEAFATARKANKPIFLSIGYSTCHWCHVMNRESFSDPEIAAFMNQHFINIKLDREERPDVDQVYMTFVQATTGGGGWPMSVWLTPELDPIVGGTYFPPRDAYGRPGFLSVLRHLAGAWTDQEEAMRTQASEVTSRLRDYTSATPASDSPLKASLLDEARALLARRFDPDQGGFNPAPKFPSPSELFFLLDQSARLGTASPEGKRAIGMVSLTLEKMSRGGIHDHLGGGVHRYSVDAFWHVPHFEKMLYDQAQLAKAYLIAYQLTGREDFAATARDILAYVQRDMTGPEGGFYSAEDADSLIAAGSHEKAEGAFYVWTVEEINSALGPERAKEFIWFYGAESDGNAPPGSDPHGEFEGKNILIQRHSLAEAASHFQTSEEEIRSRLADSRARLLKLRAERPRPHLDDKIITAWNGLMISTFARAHQILGEESYLTTANRAADFLHQHLYDHQSGTLARAWRQSATDTAGFAEDYAYLIEGLLDLYGSSLDTRRLEWALALQKKQDALFRDAGHGGYFSTTGNDPSVLMRMKQLHDGAEPSSNSVSALNLQRLDHLLGGPDWGPRASETLQSLAPSMNQSLLSLPLGLTALSNHLSPGAQIILAGDPDSAEMRKMLEAVRTSFLPGSVWALVHDPTSRTFFSQHAEFYRNASASNGRPTAYVCRNFVCELPVQDASKLRERLTTHTRPRN